jgi:DHA1 family tetracycline resistance protein-like MFS transporter
VVGWGDVKRARSRPPLPPGFGTIWTSVAIDLVGFGIVFPILPLYARRFHVSSATATGLVAAFSAASFLFSPLWGRVSDRVGRKPILLLSLAGTAAGSLLTGLAGGIVVLYIARIIDGISGASISVAQAAVSDVASAQQRPRLFGLLGAAFGIGFVAGPALGALAAVVGPRVPFYLAAAVAGINAVIAARRLPETHHPAKEEAAPRGVRNWNPLAALAGAQGASQLISVAFFTLLSFSAFEATFSLFGHSRLGFDVGSSAGVFAVIGLVIVVVQGGLVHPVVLRLGEMGTLRAGLLAEVAGLLGLAFVHSWGALVPALLALTVGQGLVQTTMSSALAGRAPPQRRGAVLGAQQSAGGLARVLGPILGGILFERIGPGSPYVAGAAVVGVCLLLLQSAVASPANTPL